MAQVYQGDHCFLEDHQPQASQEALVFLLDRLGQVDLKAQLDPVDQQVLCFQSTQVALVAQ